MSFQWGWDRSTVLGQQSLAGSLGQFDRKGDTGFLEHYLTGVTKEQAWTSSQGFRRKNFLNNPDYLFQAGMVKSTSSNIELGNSLWRTERPVICDLLLRTGTPPLYLLITLSFCQSGWTSKSMLWRATLAMWVILQHFNTLFSEELHSKRLPTD